MLRLVPLLRPPLSFLLAAAVAVAGLAFTLAPASAQWTHDPNAIPLALCLANDSQTNAVVVPDGSGGAFVAWEDYRDGTHLDTYVRRVSATGLALWTANGVAASANLGRELHPQLVGDGAGGVIVCWEDWRTATADIFAQHFNAAGTPLWGVNGIGIAVLNDDQYDPRMVSDGAGGAIVTWTDHRSASNYDVYAQRVNGAGVAQWAANGVAISALPTSNQEDPTIAADGAGGAIIAWRDMRAGNSDVYAQRVNAAGVTQWTANGIPLTTVSGEQTMPLAITDGFGGAIVAWQDTRGGGNDVYAQRVAGNGAMLWASGGRAVCTADRSQEGFRLAGDGVGGAIVTWTDYRSSVSNPSIYAQRMNASGVPLWTSNGIAVCTAPGAQVTPAITADSFGGAVIAWADSRYGNADIYAQRVTANGAMEWASDGMAVTHSAMQNQMPAIAWDGAGGGIIAWEGARAGSTYDIYAQRVEHFGVLGDPEPVITSVRDVPNDQGGRLKVSWRASYLDADPFFDIYEYRLWRSVPQAAMAMAARAGRAVTADPDVAAREGALLVLPAAGLGYAWELVAYQPAGPLPAYSLVASTPADSGALGFPRTAFMVQATTSYYTSAPYWFSAPDSGYSVDNIPPAPPVAFAASAAGGVTTLHWAANGEPDIACYRLYRGASADFVPGPGNLVVAALDTVYADVGGGGAYKLSAVDRQGNESGFATLQSGVLAAGDAAPLRLAFAPITPNPVRYGATFRFDLPRTGHAVLTVFDQQGRRVRVVAAGVMPAGHHELSWDCSDGIGRPAPNGVYFGRLEAGGRSIQHRFAVIR